MSVLECFSRKLIAGLMEPESAARLRATIEEFKLESQKTMTPEAAELAGAIAALEYSHKDAIAKANARYHNARAQLHLVNTIENTEGILTGLREQESLWGSQAPIGFRSGQSAVGFAARSTLDQMIFDITPGKNVWGLTKYYVGVAQSYFAEGFEALRPKNLGFKAEKATEVDLLRASYGEATATAQGNALFAALTKSFDFLSDSFRQWGGVLAKMPNYFPNPELDAAKAIAAGKEKYTGSLRDRLDRSKMIDYKTELPMTDERFEQFLNEHWDNVRGVPEETLSPTVTRGRMLAFSRDYERVLQFKDADAWMGHAEDFGTHASPLQSIVDHINGLARDTSILQMTGANPTAYKNFVENAINRDVFRLQRSAPDDATPRQRKAVENHNKRVEADANKDKRRFNELFDQITGAANRPGNAYWAAYMAEARAWFASSQLGSSVISSFNDVAMVEAAARHAGLPPAQIISRAIELMASGPEAEVFGLRASLSADLMIDHVSRFSVDGDVVTRGLGNKMSNAVQRASGQRKWTAAFKQALGEGWLQQLAENRGKSWNEVGQFRKAFDAIGFSEADWDKLRAMDPAEPHPGATMYLLNELHEAGEIDLAQKVSQLASYTQRSGVLEVTPQLKAHMMGGTSPGTLGGETWRSIAQYKSFPAAMMLNLYGRMFARGFDGSHMSAVAINFLTLTGLGMLSFQAKAMLAGKEPAAMDSGKLWANAVAQGGGLGFFGDLVLAKDVTKYGNSWMAALAGPLPTALDQAGRRWLITNISNKMQGKETHFWGDSIYTVAGLIPGSTLWYQRVAFQREILDQLHMAADGHRTKQTFRNAERTYREDFNARYWWRPGQTAPNFAQ